MINGKFNGKQYTRDRYRGNVRTALIAHNTPRAVVGKVLTDLRRCLNFRSFVFDSSLVFAPRAMTKTVWVRSRTESHD